MNSFKIKTNSQSFKFLTKWSYRDYNIRSERPKTFCQYYLSLFKCVLVAFLIYLGIGCLALSGFDLLYCAFHHGQSFIMDKDSSVFTLIYIMIGYVLLAFTGAALCVALAHYIVNSIATKICNTWVNKKPAKKSDSFFATAYKAYKQKYCPMITYDDIDDGE